MTHTQRRQKHVGFPEGPGDRREQLPPWQKIRETMPAGFRGVTPSGHVKTVPTKKGKGRNKEDNSLPPLNNL